jgi:hypothetical protein
VRDVPHDARVLELREGGRFAREALAVGRRLVQEFQRHRPARREVARAIDRPHPAGSRLALDLESPCDTFAGRQPASHAAIRLRALEGFKRDAMRGARAGRGRTPPPRTSGST